MSLLKIEDNAGKNVVAYGCTGSYSYASFDKPCYFTYFLFEFGILRKDIFGITVQHLPCGCKVDGAARAVKEFCFILFLKGLNLQAHRRLGQVNNLRRLRKTFCLGNCAKNF